MSAAEIAVALVTGIWAVRPDDPAIRELVARVYCGWLS